MADSQICKQITAGGENAGVRVQKGNMLSLQEVSHRRISSDSPSPPFCGIKGRHHISEKIGTVHVFYYFFYLSREDL
jgi:hypothetical protein